MKINYHNRRFKAVKTSSNGEVTAAMVFHYEQSQNIVTCRYSGGSIIEGHLIGLVDEDGNIYMRYHQVNAAGELRTGKCSSRPELLEDGRIRLHESWQWTSGGRSQGTSVLEEV